MSKQIKMTGFAASEMDMQHEVIECGDEYGAFFSQWTGTHVVVFDEEHAIRMGFMATYIANDMDQDIARLVERRRSEINADLYFVRVTSRE